MPPTTNTATGQLARRARSRIQGSASHVVKTNQQRLRAIANTNLVLTPRTGLNSLRKGSPGLQGVSPALASPGPAPRGEAFTDSFQILERDEIAVALSGI